MRFGTVFYGVTSENLNAHVCGQTCALSYSLNGCTSIVQYSNAVTRVTKLK